jgi:UDP-glucose 4-epimerase
LKVAIIGINGYIAQNLAFMMKKSSFVIYGYGRQTESIISIENYKQIDVTSLESCTLINTDVDFVFYFAGATGTFKAYETYENFIDVNEKGLMNVLTLLVKNKSKARVIFPSTRLVYKGIENTPLEEDAEKEFKTIYALTKWYGEQVLRQYHTYFNIPFIIFRICVPYGNLTSSTYSYGTVGFFLKMAQTGQSITLYGDGSLKRTFTYIEDICNQIILALQNPNSIANVYNIAGETLSLLQVAQTITTKYKGSIKHLEWPIMDQKIESGDTIFNGNKLLNLLEYNIKNNFYNWIQTI